MTNLTLGQVTELTERVRARLAEFGEDAFDQPSLGVIRLVYDVIEEWHEDAEATERAEDDRRAEVTAIHDKAFTEGWQAGRESIRREQAIQNMNSDYAIPDAPRFAPATIADAHTNGGIAHANGSTVRDVAAPEPELHFVAGNNGTGNVPPLGSLEKHVAATTPTPLLSADAPQPVSADAATALGVEHTLVAPLLAEKPRTLEEVDESVVRKAARGSAERAAQLRAIIGELQIMSPDGATMPTMADWDEKKPVDMPLARNVCLRFDLTWNDLAKYAHLDQNPRGRRNRGSVVA